MKETLSLGERTYRCKVCGFQEDRDINAAMNLRNLAVSSTVDKACCPESAGSSRKMRTKLLAGQELSRLESACDSYHFGERFKLTHIKTDNS